MAASAVATAVAVVGPLQARPDGRLKSIVSRDASSRFVVDRRNDRVVVGLPSGGFGSQVGVEACHVGSALGDFVSDSGRQTFQGAVKAGAPCGSGSVEGGESRGLSVQV